MSKMNIPVLMYHYVSEVTEGGEQARNMDPDYCISPYDFYEQMLYLFENKFKTINAKQFLDLSNITSG